MTAIVSCWSSGQRPTGPRRDSGTGSSHHPGHRAINHSAGTGFHFLNSYQSLQGTKRPFVGSIKPEVLHSPQVLRFMNDGDRDQRGKRHT